MDKQKNKPHTKPKDVSSAVQQAPPYPWDVFDRAQFERKMSLWKTFDNREMARQMNELQRENRVIGIKVVTGMQFSQCQMASLRRWPGEITRLACEVMEEQGLAFTPTFYRGIIEHLARPILIRKAESVIQHIASRSGRRRTSPPAHDRPIDVEDVHLSRIIEEERTKLEIEARKLEYPSSRKPRDESQTTQLHQAPPIVQTHSKTQAATRERGPDFETMRKRVEYEDKLREDLGAILPLTKQYTTVGTLKARIPNSELWKILSDKEQRELLTEEFKPRAYARTLTGRKFTISKWAIEKYRPALRKQRS